MIPASYFLIKISASQDIKKGNPKDLNQAKVKLFISTLTLLEKRNKESNHTSDEFFLIASQTAQMLKMTMVFARESHKKRGSTWE